MTINRKLLECLVCPVSRERLQEADSQLIDGLNDLIAKGKLSNKRGDRLKRPIDGGLVRLDKTLLYPIYDDIPNLLVDEAIEVPAL